MVPNFPAPPASVTKASTTKTGSGNCAANCSRGSLCAFETKVNSCSSTVGSVYRTDRRSCAGPASGTMGGSEATVIQQLPPRACHDLREADPSIVLLDVRTPAEFAEGHPAGALNVPIVMFGP